MSTVLKKSASDEGAERAVLHLSALPERQAPGRVLIAPWGEVKSSNGTFVVDGESARELIAAFESQGTDLPIDYEHQSLGGAYASPNGQAPAAGWIRKLELIEPGDGATPAGLYAEVQWTETGKEKLAAREYRYLSPVVIVRKDDRRVVGLHSAALTNKPAIVGMRPIVNRAEVIEDESLTNSPAMSALRERLGMGDDEAEAVLASAEAKLSELSAEVSARLARDKVTAAMGAGKLLPHQREWATGMAMKDPCGFEAWAEQAPTVVMLGRTEGPTASGGTGRQAVIASARATYRSEPQLAGLTSEAAFVNEALREAGLFEA